MDSFIVSYIDCLQSLPLDLQTFTSDYLDSDVHSNRIMRSIVSDSEKLSETNSRRESNAKLDQLLEKISLVSSIYDSRISEILKLEDKFTAHQWKLANNAVSMSEQSPYSAYNALSTEGSSSHPSEDTERLMFLSKMLRKMHPVLDSPGTAKEKKQQRNLGLMPPALQPTGSVKEDVQKPSKRLSNSLGGLNKRSTVTSKRGGLSCALVRKSQLNGMPDKARMRHKSRLSQLASDGQLSRAFAKRGVSSKFSRSSRLTGSQSRTTNDRYRQQQQRWLGNKQHHRLRRGCNSMVSSRRVGSVKLSKKSRNSSANATQEQESDHGEASSYSAPEDAVPSKRSRGSEAAHPDRNGNGSTADDRSDVASLENHTAPDSVSRRSRGSGTRMGRGGGSSSSVQKRLRARQDDSPSSTISTSTRGGKARLSNMSEKRAKLSARTRNDSSDGDSSDGSTDKRLYCVCKRVSYGDMIGCDNKKCEIEWFHFSCMSIKIKPKGKWYCPRCRGDSHKVKRTNV